MVHADVIEHLDRTPVCSGNSRANTLAYARFFLRSNPPPPHYDNERLVEGDVDAPCLHVVLRREVPCEPLCFPDAHHLNEGGLVVMNKLQRAVMLVALEFPDKIVCPVLDRGSP